MIAIRLPFQFDVQRMLEDIARLPDEAFHEVESNHITKGGLFAANLLVPDLEVARSEKDFVLVPGPWLTSSPYLMEVINTFQSEKNLARVHKLQPKARIDEHVDGMNFLQGLMRIHVPVTTGEGSSFVLAGESLTLLPGESWFLNVSRPHWVENRDEQERIHLIIDCQRNDWWDDLLRELDELPEENAYSNMSDTDLENMRSMLEGMKEKGTRIAMEQVDHELKRRNAGK